MDRIAAYQENAVVTQSPGRTIVLLYDGAIRFIKQGVAAAQRNDFVERNRLLQKAVAILDELNITLDMEAGGEIAANLRRLYLFMIRHLTHANIHNDTQKMQEVVSLLAELNQSWRSITE